MKVQTTRFKQPPWFSPGDTVSIFDNDGREIAIQRYQIPELTKLLKEES